MTKIKSLVATALLSLILIGTASCDDNLVYEKEGDCSVKVQFVFKKHRQALNSRPGMAADNFYSTVESVHLFIFDAGSGELVADFTEKTDNLKSAADLKIGKSADRCYLPVDLEPGTYRLIAWCGLDSDDRSNAFELSADGSRADAYSNCRVLLDAAGMPVHREKYDALYHGMVNEAVVTLSDGGQVIPIELTKDTNDISVWVQHTTQTFEKGDYEVVYTDANGTLRFEDNVVTSTTPLEYRPHTTTLLSANTEYNGAIVEAGALVAHISTSRLLDSHAADARLEVRNKEGKTVFSIPFIKYVLQMQTFTNDSQYYLDCEDTYNCSFYLTGDAEGEGGLWMPAMIIINNWVKVPDQVDELK